MAESRSNALTVVLSLLVLTVVAATPATVLFMRTRGPAVAAISLPALGPARP